MGEEDLIVEETRQDANCSLIVRIIMGSHNLVASCQKDLSIHVYRDVIEKRTNISFACGRDDYRD